MSSVFLPFLFCALSLCLQEEGVVSFCKVCVVGFVSTPFHHLPNNTKKKAHPLPPFHPSRLYASHPTPPPQPLQQHVPQSIRNLNYPSPLWTGCSGSPSPALWGKWLKPPDPIFIFSVVFLGGGSVCHFSIRVKFRSVISILVHCSPFYSDVKSRVRGSLSCWLWF